MTLNQPLQWAGPGGVVFVRVPREISGLPLFWDRFDDQQLHIKPSKLAGTNERGEVVDPATKRQARLFSVDKLRRVDRDTVTIGFSLYKSPAESSSYTCEVHREQGAWRVVNKRLVSMS